MFLEQLLEWATRDAGGHHLVRNRRARKPFARIVQACLDRRECTWAWRQLGAGHGHNDCRPSSAYHVGARSERVWLNLDVTILGQQLAVEDSPNLRKSFHTSTGGLPASSRVRVDGAVRGGER